jgi:hypothetical protein
MDKITTLIKEKSGYNYFRRSLILIISRGREIGYGSEAKIQEH